MVARKRKTRKTTPRLVPILVASLVYLAASTECDAAEGVISEGADASSARAKPTLTRQAALPGQSDRKPNVIWILLDAARAKNLSCYGYSRKTTPNIDKLAARGVLFEQAFAQGNQTAISVPSYMTGRYFPVWMNSRGSWRDLARIPPPDEVPLPTIMQQNGYLTAAFSSHVVFLRGCRLYKAFESFTVVPWDREKNNYPSFEDLNALIRPWLRRQRDRPFFLYIHALDTHFPHFLSPPYDKWLDKSLPGGARLQAGGGSPFWKAEQEYLRGLYDGSLLYADKCIGDLIAELESLDLLEQTLVIIGSDHGEALGEDGVTFAHGEDLTSDEVLQVPLIMAGPGLPQERRVAALTENADIVPTLIELLGLETKAKPDGKSLLPLFRNEAPLRDYVFSTTLVTRDDCGFVVRDTKYKYAFRPKLNSESLWTVPDHVGKRREILNQEPDVAALMRQRVREDLMPLWEAYNNLPYDDPPPFEEFVDFDSVTIEPPEAWVERPPWQGSWIDNKWARHGKTLRSCAWQEDAPPLTLRVDVPNGRYRVLMNVISTQINGHPASAFVVKTENDAAFKKIVSSQEGEGYKVYRYMDIGEHEITDGTFNITLDEGDRNYWAILRGFRFVPIREGIEALSIEELEQREEQLRALGYLD